MHPYPNQQFRGQPSGLPFWSKHQPAEIRAARIAAVAAVIAALISGMSGIFTYVSTQNQIAAEDRRSLSEFQRDQRQKAYAQFIADERSLDQAEYALSIELGRIYIPSIPGSRPTDPNEAAKLAKTVNDAYSKFSLTSGNLRLVASPKASKFIEEFTSNHDSYVRKMTRPYRLPDEPKLDYSRIIDDFEERIIGVAQEDLA